MQRANVKVHVAFTGSQMLATKMMQVVSLNEAINKQKNNHNFNVLKNGILICLKGYIYLYNKYNGIYYILIFYINILLI